MGITIAPLVALGGWMRRGFAAVRELLGRSASTRRAAAKVGRAVERDASILARDDVNRVTLSKILYSE